MSILPKRVPPVDAIPRPKGDISIDQFTKLAGQLIEAFKEEYLLKYIANPNDWPSLLGEDEWWDQLMVTLGYRT